MSENTKSFGVAIGILAEAYRAKISSATIKAYELALGDLPIDQVEAACEHSLKTRKFMPPPAELREFVLCGGMTLEHRTELAWKALDRAIEKYGYDHTIVFDDPAITAVVRALGGLERICKLPNEQFHVWFKKEFISSYERFVHEPPRAEMCGSLIGQFDRENQLNGYSDHLQQPIIVKCNLPKIPGAPDVRALLDQTKQKRKLLDDLRNESEQSNDDPDEGENKKKRP